MAKNTGVPLFASGDTICLKKKHTCPAHAVA